MRSLLKIIFIIFILYSSAHPQWEKLNEGISGRADDIHFLDDKIGWVTGYNLLVKTEDGGESWKNIELPYDKDFLMITMTSDLIGWAYGTIDSREHILKTNDGGKTWLSSFLFPSNEYSVSYIAGVNDSLAYVSGSVFNSSRPKGFIFKTNDEGETWVDISSDFQDREIMEIQANDASLLIALAKVYSKKAGDSDYHGHAYSILKTMDGGTSWDEFVISGFGESVYGNIELFNLKYINESTAYFISQCYLEEWKPGIYSSTDSLKTWSQILYSDYPVNSCQFLNTSVGYALVRDSLENSIIIKTNDAGNNWETLQKFTFGIDEFIFIEEDTGFALSNRFLNVWKTTDYGNMWTKKVFTYPFINVCILDEQRILAFGGIRRGWHRVIYEGDMFSTNDGGNTWQHELRADLIVKSCLFVNDNLVYRLMNKYDAECKIDRSDNKGDSWYTVFENNYDKDFQFAGKDFDVWYNQNVWAVGIYSDPVSRGGGILGTPDSGKSWEIIWKYPDSGYTDYEFSSIDIINNTAWIAGTNGFIMKYKEPDNWQIKKGITDIPLNTVFFSDEQHGWITGGYLNDQVLQSILLITKNAGETWAEKKFNKYLINDMFFADSLFGWAVGQDKRYHGMVLETTDGGENWNPVIENLAAPLNGIQFKDGYGWAVGENGLVFKTNDGTTWVNQNTGEKYPSKINLAQNYPNPFNPTTTIEFTLPRPAYTTLKVYNILGAELGTLIAEHLPAGLHRCTFDSSKLASSVYYYEVRSGAFRDVKKMILLR